MIAAVVPRPVRRVCQPEIGTEVDDDGLIRQAARDRRGLPSGQREEDQIRVRFLDRGVRLEYQSRKRAIPGQVRVHSPDRLARATVRGDCRKLQVWMRADE